MGRGFGALAAATVVVGLAIGVGFGMWQSGQAATNAAQAAGVMSVGQVQTGSAQRPQASSAAGQAGNAVRSGPGLLGTVESLAGDTLTVRSSGASTKVLLSADTAIRKTTSLTASEIRVGEAVTVIGTKNADGVVVARSIQIGGAEAVFQVSLPQGAQAGLKNGAGREGNAPTSPMQGSFGNMTQITGTVESANADKVVVNTSNGTATMSVSDQTTTRKTEPASRSDLVAGINVMVVGQLGSDGSMVASIIQITPDGAGGGMTGQAGQGGRARQSQ